MGFMVIHALHINEVVLDTDQLDPDDACPVLHFHHQAVLVAAELAPSYGSLTS